MNNKSLVVLGAAALLFSYVSVADETDNAKLVTRIDENTIELTVPVSALSMTFPKGGFTTVDGPRTGAQSGPRYFYFADKQRALFVSGWFEAQESFPKEFWKGEFASMKKSGLVLKDRPTEIRVGDWSGAAYDLDVSKLGAAASKAVNANIRAELMKAGTWIDLHISVTDEIPPQEARDRALEFLKSIVVTEKH